MKLKLSNESLYFILGSQFVRCNYENGELRAWNLNPDNKTPYDLTEMVNKIKGLCLNIENQETVNILNNHINAWERILKNYKGAAIAQNARNIDKLIVPGVKEVCEIFNNIDCELNSKTTFGLVLGVESHKIKELIHNFFTSPDGVLQQKELCKAVYDNSLKEYEHPPFIYRGVDAKGSSFDVIFKAGVDFLKYWTTQVLLEKSVDCDQAMTNLNMAFRPAIKNATGAKSYCKVVDKILTKKKATPEQIKKYVGETVDFLKDGKYFTQIDEFNALLEKSGNVVSNEIESLDFNGDTMFARNYRLSLESVARHFAVNKTKAAEIADKLLDNFRVFLTGEPEFKDVVLDMRGSKASMTSYLSVEYTDTQREEVEPLVDKYYKIFLGVIPLLKPQDANDSKKISNIIQSAITKELLDVKLKSVEAKTNDDIELGRNSFKL